MCGPAALPNPSGLLLADACSQMKRCPQCHRAENEDTLTFCRVDGTPLVRESSAASESAGTLKFGSAPDAGETETRSLPQAGAALPTDEAMHRPTAPTAVLDTQRAADGARVLSNLKASRTLVIIAALAIALMLAVLAYYSLSRKNPSTAIGSVAVLPFVNTGGDPVTCRL